MTITEEENENIVNINQHKVGGFLSEENCPNCGTRKVYHEDFDAYFCPQENIWLESQCGDPECDYCKKRPKVPLQA